MICRLDISRFPYVTKNTVTVSELITLACFDEFSFEETTPNLPAGIV